LAGIDLQLYVGEVEDATATGIPATVSAVADWCNAKHGRCGPRLSTTPHWASDKAGGYDTRTEAAAKCQAEGMQLCKKAELAGHSVRTGRCLVELTLVLCGCDVMRRMHLQGCESGWCADWEGFWMATTSKGCGRKHMS
jgi:hypothetical protein